MRPSSALPLVGTKPRGTESNDQAVTLKNLFGPRPFRRFYIETAGGNYVEVENERHIMVARPSHDLIIVYGTDGLVHHHRLATEHGGSIYFSLRSV